MENAVNQKIKFLDVGHGDSSIICVHDAGSECFKTAVIDIVDADKLIVALQQYAIKVIDFIIISHFDADHCKGVNDFIEKYCRVGNVKNICFNIDRNYPTRTMRFIVRRFVELYRKQGIHILRGNIDTNMKKRELISGDAATLSIIYPNVAEDAEAYLQHSSNNMSIVCLYESKVCNVIFSGDLENEGWCDLLQRMPNLKCDVLKMPHHGAFYPEVEGMGTGHILEILQPQVAIISTGENKKYKHPAYETIELLNEKKIKVYCTQYTSLCHSDMKEPCKKCFGDVELLINDLNYVIKTEKNVVGSLKFSVCSRN